ncbi:Calx-beta domain-containing protein [Actinoplanes subtropicus]|uniref:Calx-beta domain-containing protein n=1 Tax=Actinoplanes subtropicus TaxID=543632 RepID=UPI000B049918|nr:Calx-beta domain-containing protein [Actinoplanes subtropicus]
MPAVMVSSPAFAATSSSDVTLAAGGGAGITPTEAQSATLTLTWVPATAPATNLTWSTADATATAGSDYTAVKAQPISFTGGGAGATATLNVSTLADTLYEGAETFKVNVYDPNNATPIATQTVTITDSQSAPDVAVTPASVTEGNNGWHSQTFTLTMTPASQAVQAVHWAAVDTGSAVDGTDFKAASGDVTFASGETTKTFTVDINGDKTYDGADETFDIGITAINRPGTSTMSDVTSTNQPFTTTITDDDAKPTYSVPNINATAGAAASAALVAIKLSNPTDLPVAFALTSSPGTAANNTEFSLPAQTVTIPAGSDTGYGVLLINGTTVFGPTKSATIIATPGSNKSELAGAGATAANATLTIANGATAPVITISPDKVAPGDSVHVIATVTGSSSADTPVNFTFAGGSVNGSKAASPSDFSGPTTTSITIPANTASGTTYDLGALTTTKPTTSQPDKTILVSGVAFGGGATVKNSVITITAGSGTPTPGSLTISAPSNVQGAVAVPVTGMAAASTAVELWGAPVGGGDMAKLQTTTSDAKGSYAFSRWIGMGYKFSVHSGSDTSKVVTVTVTQVPVFVASTTKGMASFAVQGNPRAAGQTVIVQRYLGGKWANVARGLTGSNNQWRGAVKIASGTMVAVRAFVAGDTTSGIMGGYSDIKRFKIK